MLRRADPESVHPSHIHALPEVEVLLPVYAVVHDITAYSFKCWLISITAKCSHCGIMLSTGWPLSGYCILNSISQWLIKWLLYCEIHICIAQSTWSVIGQIYYMYKHA